MKKETNQQVSVTHLIAFASEAKMLYASQFDSKTKKEKKLYVTKGGYEVWINSDIQKQFIQAHAAAEYYNNL